jgi:hypothetical protein
MPPPSKRMKTTEFHSAGCETDLLCFQVGVGTRRDSKEQDSIDTFPAPALISELNSAITSRGRSSDKQLPLAHPAQKTSIHPGRYKYKRNSSPFKIYEDPPDMELPFTFVDLDGYSSSDDKENVSVHEDDDEDLEAGLREVHPRTSWETPNLIVRRPRVRRGPPRVETFRVGRTRREDPDSDDEDTSSVDSEEETELDEEAAYSFSRRTSLNIDDLALLMYYNDSPIHELDGHLGGRLSDGIY